MSGQNNRSVLLSGLSLVASGACAEGKRLFLICAGIKGASRLGEAELDLITACVTLTELPGVDLMVKAAASGYLAWLMESKLWTGMALAEPVQQALVQRLGDPDGGVRRAAAQALAASAGAEPVQQALVQRLGDPDGGVRYAAAQALAASAGAPEVQAALLPLLKDEREWKLYRDARRRGGIRAHRAHRLRWR